MSPWYRLGHANETDWPSCWAVRASIVVVSKVSRQLPGSFSRLCRETSIIKLDSCSSFVSRCTPSGQIDEDRR